MSPASAPVTSLSQQGAAAPIEPDFAVFVRLYEEGVPQVAWTRLVADLETPVSAMLATPIPATRRPSSASATASSAAASNASGSISVPCHGVAARPEETTSHDASNTAALSADVPTSKPRWRCRWDEVVRL